MDSEKRQHHEGSPDRELPEYPAVGGSRAELTQHDYQLEDSKGRSWLFLSLRSHAKSEKQLPLFHNGDIIAGDVALDFDKTSGVQAVFVAIIAGVTAVGQEEARFLHLPATLWDGKSTTSAVAKPTGKQSWPFSLALPSEIALPGKGKRASQTYILPPSFSERASPAYVEYKVIVTVRRGLFRANQTLSTAIVYLPHWRADPPSASRHAAYRNGTPLVSPEFDPDGWKVLSPVTVKGTLFNARQVEVQCTLAVARPLSFARGSPIPLFLTVAGADEQAVGVLAAPAAIKVHLRRSRVLGPYATNEEADPPSDKVFRDIVGTAYFWPLEQGSSGRTAQTLQGELSVNVGLKPSFTFPEFSLKYHLVLLPPQASGFSCKGSASEALLTEQAVIASAEAMGVLSRRFAPPGYVPPDDTDYNNSVGYLENGNQRFLHHSGQPGL